MVAALGSNSHIDFILSVRQAWLKWLMENTLCDLAATRTIGDSVVARRLSYRYVAASQENPQSQLPSLYLALKTLIDGRERFGVPSLADWTAAEAALAACSLTGINHI